MLVENFTNDKESNLMLRTKYSEKIEKQMKAYFDTLNEKDRRGYAAIEAMKFIGHRLRSYFRLPLLFFESDPIISYSNHSSLNLFLFTCGSNA